MTHGSPILMPSGSEKQSQKIGTALIAYFDMQSEGLEIKTSMGETTQGDNSKGVN